MPFTPEDVKAVADIIKNSKYLVAFTGAGISTESGLPDYRGPDGVWTRRDLGLPPPKSKQPMELTEPNPGHLALVKLYQIGILKFVISQNVDNLHLKSGIPKEKITELHGNYTLLNCLECDSRFSKNEMGWEDEKHGKGYRTEKTRSGQPPCPRCKGRLISSVVNFNDPMPEREMQESEEQSRRCDVMFVIGSSLSVFPAANFPVMAKQLGSQLIILNEGKTALDEVADVRIDAKSGVFLPLVIEEITSSNF
ncbi:MAG: NAD-dependent deacetylase [Candidatus Heimdallarchaeota archaeon]